jgi:hypothetical protein
MADALDEQADERRGCPESKIDLTAHELFGVRPPTFDEGRRMIIRLLLTSTLYCSREAARNTRVIRCGLGGLVGGTKDASRKANESCGEHSRGEQPVRIRFSQRLQPCTTQPRTPRQRTG